METNMAMMAEQLSVKFVDILEKYPCTEDLECKYTCVNSTVQDGDRIAIFKLGWKSLKNYILFEWAMPSYPTAITSVVFSKYDLPNNPNETDDLYQFCYISGQNVVQGISTPFQIVSTEPKPAVNMTDSLKNETQCLHLKQLLSLKDREILKLKEENAILKESIKALVGQRKFQETKSYDDDINALKDLTKQLQNALLGQQKEIDLLKLDRKNKIQKKNLMLERIMAADDAKNAAKFDFKFDLESLQPLPDFPFDVSQLP